jgi:hypothetical protein
VPRQLLIRVRGFRKFLLANGDPLVPEGSVMWKLCGRAVDLGNGGGEWDERI